MIRMLKKITTEQMSKRLLKLTVILQISFFAFLGCIFGLFFHTPKYMLYDPGILLEAQILTGLTLLSVASLAIIYTWRLVRWRKHRISN